jgi:tetratricopeptide (TPR) repeat protein
MIRALLAAIGVGTIVLGGAIAWNTVHQEREFRRLIAVGQDALAREATFEAIEAFSGAIALKGDSMLAYLKRGDTYRRRGELSAALRDLREAALLDPGAPQPLERLGDVNVAMGRYERAAQHYRAVIALDDRAPVVLYKLALAHYRNGQATLALDPLRRALAIDDRFVEAQYLLGVCLHDRKREDEALRALRRAIEINPAFSPAREELANLYSARGRTSQAIDELEALAALEPTRAERLVNVGLAYARAGRSEAAIVALGRAAERFPTDAAIYTALGRVWLQNAESHNDPIALRKAVEALESGASRASATNETLSLYGRALFLKGDLNEAERVLQRATRRLPVDPIAFRSLALTAERLGHIAIGREALIQYVGLMDDPETRLSTALHVAELSLRMNDAELAAKWAQRAIAPQDPDANALGLLADAQLRLGQPDAARATLERGLRKDATNRTLLRLRQRLGT